MDSQSWAKRSMARNEYGTEEQNGLRGPKFGLA
jgi:hypothetical protein